MRIPRDHPRYESLKTREALVKAHRQGIAVLEGLIAHGRGEAWDYLLGEKTIAPALVAEKAAAAFLVRAERPVVSVNGNVAALAAKPVVRLAKAVPAKIEINLFHRTEARVKRIRSILRKAGADVVLGANPNARIPGLASRRGLCHREGIYRADVALVPLEDGDRAEALARMKKVVISVDLNPLSRTSQTASVAVVDELSRALPNIERFVQELKDDPDEAERIAEEYDARRNLSATYAFILWRLVQLFEGKPPKEAEARHPRTERRKRKS